MKILFPYMARWKAMNWTRYHSLLTELAEMGHKVYVFQPPPTISNETNFQEIEVDISPNIVLFDVKVPLRLWNRKFPFEKLYKKGIYSLWSYSSVGKLIREKEIDVMLLYNIPQYLLSRYKTCKIVFDLADDYIDMLAQELGPLSNRITLGMASKLLENMLDSADYVLAVSRVLADQFCKKAIVLPNGVSPKKADSAKWKPLNLKISKPIVGFIGSFEYFIDFDLIIEVAAELPTINFLLVGYGRSWSEVQQKVSELGLKNVHMPGGVKHEDIFRYINEMDVCLNIFKKIPVSHAACPMKVFEYMVMEKPVISTRLKEIENMKLGPIIYADNSKETVQAIQYLLNNPQKVRELGRVGRSLVLERYTWRRVAKHFVSALESKCP